MICITKYENDIFSLNETSNGFMHAFCLSKIHFHKPGSFKLIKMPKSFRVLLSLSLMKSLSKATMRSIMVSRLIKLKLKFSKKKCQNTSMSTDTSPSRELIQPESIIKTLILYNLV